MTLTAVFLIAGAYLFGAVPSAYLVARYIKGIDIRQYGSGNMGATNVMAFVGNRTGFLLGSYDCLAKGTLPVVLANLLDQSIGVQIGAAIAVEGPNNEIAKTILPSKASFAVGL